MAATSEQIETVITSPKFVIPMSLGGYTGSPTQSATQMLAKTYTHAGEAFAFQACPLGLLQGLLPE